MAPSSGAGEEEGAEDENLAEGRDEDGDENGDGDGGGPGGGDGGGDGDGDGPGGPGAGPGLGRILTGALDPGEDFGAAPQAEASNLQEGQISESASRLRDATRNREFDVVDPDAEELEDELRNPGLTSNRIFISGQVLEGMLPEVMPQSIMASARSKVAAASSRRSAACRASFALEIRVAEVNERISGA